MKLLSRSPERHRRPAGTTVPAVEPDLGLRRWGSPAACQAGLKSSGRGEADQPRDGGRKRVLDCDRHRGYERDQRDLGDRRIPTDEDDIEIELSRVAAVLRRQACGDAVA